MRIIQFQAENVKRIKAIDITPESNIIVISGRNGAGKTSVLDAIWSALEYRRASKDNPQLLRAGETRGETVLDLGDYIVTRTFTEGGTQLKVTNPTGDKVASPQKLLDGLIGDLAFDPWEFSRKNDKEQRQILGDLLYQLTGGKVDLDEFERKKKAFFERRKELNREKTRLTGVITSFKPPTAEDPTEEQSVEDLTTAITEASKQNLRRNELQATNLRIDASVVEKNRELEKLKETIVDLEGTKSQNLDDLTELTDIPDVEFLQGQFKEIDTINKRAREVIEYEKTKIVLEELKSDISGLNDSMELLEIEKAEALEDAPLPIDNIAVTPDGICVINDEGEQVPFVQASAAQRLRISLAIAMASKPKLRVIRIADGSLLDDDSMAIIKEMADTEDFQVWIEYASRNDGDRMGVYIEDGLVAEVERAN